MTTWRELTVIAVGDDVAALAQFLVDSEGSEAHLTPLFQDLHELPDDHPLRSESIEVFAHMRRLYGVSGVSQGRLNGLAQELSRRPDVQGVYVKPSAVPAGGMMQVSSNEPPTATRNYFHEQGYLRPTPGGIDAQYAWRPSNLPGLARPPAGTGLGVNIIDIEWSWLLTHEDLTNPSVTNSNGANANHFVRQNHGTAVLGILHGRHNGFGVRGICPDAGIDAWGLPITMPPPGNPSLWTAPAIRNAADRLNRGDIILVEVQRRGPSDSPPQEETAPWHAEAGPWHAEAGPWHAEAGPWHAEAGPLHAEIGPLHAEVGPVHAEIGPLHAEVGPVHAEIGPLHAEVGPLHAEVAPHDHRARFLPIEWWEEDFLAIWYATVCRGVIVVEPAGNGGEDLDDDFYDLEPDRQYLAHPGTVIQFSPSWSNPLPRVNRNAFGRLMDCGAILVGAGAPLPGTHGRSWGPDRSRLRFSNYGSALDAQGWGAEVTTTAYGDLQGGGDLNRWYTNIFGGTSAAAAIVAGALASLQSARINAGAPFTPAEVRELLRITGSPQPVSSDRIGSRPDLKALFEHL